MLKIRALNRESSSDDDAPAIRREAQVKTIQNNYLSCLAYSFFPAGRNRFGYL